MVGILIPAGSVVARRLAGSSAEIATTEIATTEIATAEIPAGISNVVTRVIRRDLALVGRSSAIP